jgi:general secretion pathway protein F/type IV pilus assembly protein PilC
MPTFTYKAVAPDGKPVRGTLTAESQQGALRMLDEQSLFPVAVEEGGVATKRVIGGRKRVKLGHTTIFYSQMADLLRAGVPMLRSLDTLARLTTNPVLAEVLKEVREEVAGGAELAEAMSKHPNAFSPLHISMIRAGESGGFLEDVLARIAQFAERQDELRNKLVGSMIYPCILVFAGLGVVILLMTFVVPRFRGILRPEHYNLLTHLVFGVADFILAYYPLLVLAAGLLVFAMLAFRRTQQGRMLIARLQLVAPFFGKVFTMVSVCRFCRILGTMLHNGVPILQALKISKDSAGNHILAEEIERAAESVKKGDSLSKPLGAGGLFPLDIIAMMSVAEESNSLDTVLVQIAETNEARTARSIDITVRLLEPILLVIMAVMVLCIALALLLPILTMSTGGMRL